MARNWRDVRAQAVAAGLVNEARVHELARDKDGPTCVDCGAPLTTTGPRCRTCAGPMPAR